MSVRTPSGAPVHEPSENSPDLPALLGEAALEEWDRIDEAVAWRHLQRDE